MKEGKAREKECEMPTHLIAACVTKNQNRRGETMWHACKGHLLSDSSQPGTILYVLSKNQTVDDHHKHATQLVSPLPVCILSNVCSMGKIKNFQLSE